MIWWSLIQNDSMHWIRNCRNCDQAISRGDVWRTSAACYPTSTIYKSFNQLIMYGVALKLKQVNIDLKCHTEISTTWYRCAYVGWCGLLEHNLYLNRGWTCSSHGCSECKCCSTSSIICDSNRTPCSDSIKDQFEPQQDVCQRRHYLWDLWECSEAWSWVTWTDHQDVQGIHDISIQSFVQTNK